MLFASGERDHKPPWKKSWANMRNINIWKMIFFFKLIIITIISFWYNVERSTTFCTCASTNQFLDTKNLKNRTPSINDCAFERTGMWTVEPSGRLGNLIGQYATLYAFAKRHGHQAYILPSMHSALSKIFKIKLPVINEEVANRIPWKNLGIYKNWMAEEFKYIPGEFVKLSGYPFSWTFYHHIKDEILKEFTFHDFIREESNAYLADIRGNKTNTTFIGIHVRRGDYVDIMRNNKKGVLADKDYLQKAMEYFRKKYKNPLFVVTSNGIDWCKSNINNSLGDVYFLGDGNEGSPGRDFALLVHCNHTIMTIGTFGLYAAYLTGGETIYLANYTFLDSRHGTGLKYETVYLPEWIGIPADLTPILKYN
ncbi:galactoside alpha-(1,2)-fucosyltransferase 2-like [Rana temporaria]|uniref:galactoside alpha-(1,2)-fucosyltransferase 2-like n=1 Tax=Rana temporaria TaxID=8407 RepID=UPI001AAC696A|nr:galactoside alpha-(1,2)-fucosyltransferase 2-like [Rana temporaria]